MEFGLLFLEILRLPKEDSLHHTVGYSIITAIHQSQHCVLLQIFMPTDEQKNTLRTWVFTLSRDPVGNEPKGTGFLLDENHILTCKHVAEGFGSGKIYLRLSGIGGESVAIARRLRNEDYQHSTHDLEVLKLESPITNVSQVPLVGNASEEILERLLPGNVGCFGGNNSEWISVTGRNLSAGSRIQLEGAPDEGYSGSPLLLREFLFCGVFGVATDGGKGKGNSLYTPSTRIVEWLMSIENSTLKFKPVSIDTVLEEIALGGKNWSKMIAESWLSQWADVEGINSGSIEYANKFVSNDYEENK